MDSLPTVAERAVSVTPFHIAFPVSDLAAVRNFYGSVLGCPEGRSSDTWIDFNLFGHQIVAHHKPVETADAIAHHNPVDGHDVPVQHFGVVLTMAQWEALAERPQGNWRALHHRALYPLPRRARRTGDHVPP